MPGSREWIPLRPSTAKGDEGTKKSQGRVVQLPWQRQARGSGYSFGPALPKKGYRECSRERSLEVAVITALWEAVMQCAPSGKKASRHLFRLRIGLADL